MADTTRGLAPMLAAHPLFSGLDDARHGELAGLFVEVPFDAGELVFGPGDGAHSFYLVLAGEVVLRAPGTGPVTRVAGDGFGELGLVPGQVRRAHVAAGEAGARVAKLPRLAFERLVSEAPGAYASVIERLQDRVGPLGIELDAPADRSAWTGSPRVLAFGGPRDGAGRTTLAVNYAVHLAVEGLEVALVDLDPTGGDVALLTDVEPTRSWIDLFPEEGGAPELTPEGLRAHGLPAGGRLHVFPSPPTSEGARRPTVEDASRLVAGLGRAFDAVVIDAPAGSGPLAEAVLRAADLALIVGNYSVQGIFALNRAMAALGRAGLRHGKVQVVLNRVGRPDDAPLQESEALIVPALARVLEDPEVALAPGDGRPDVLARPSGSLAAACKRLRRRIEKVRRDRRGGERPRARRARARALLALGRSQLLEGRRSQARQALEQAAPDLPEDAEASILLGRIYEDRGELRRAGECYKAAMEADREDLHALCRAAAITRNEILLQSATRRLRRAFERHPARPDLHLLQGLVHAARGRIAEAEHSLERAQRGNPGYAEAMRRRGDLAMVRGDTELAVARYRAACQLYPVETAARAGLARAFRAAGLVGPALDAARDLARLEPDHPDAGPMVAELGREVRAIDEELRTYDEALAARALPDVLLLRAGARARRGLAKEASADAARALQIGASLPGARLLMRLVAILMVPAAEIPAPEADAAA